MAVSVAGKLRAANAASSRATKEETTLRRYKE
jgi:hypothetical protein